MTYTKPARALRKTAAGLFRKSWLMLPDSIRAALAPHILDGLPDSAKFRLGIPTLRGTLENLKKAGFEPFTIIDVGANVGDWSLTAAAVYPNSAVLLIDGDPANDKALAEVAKSRHKNARHYIAVLGPDFKDDCTFYVLGTGSSVLPELTSFTAEPIHLPMQTLDGLVTTYGSLKVPILLKLDVQGYELEVLRGGSQTLADSEVVILESSLLPYNSGSPLIAEAISFMHERGFSVYDFCGQLRRFSDQALLQTDIVFAKTNSVLRSRRKFWVHESDDAYI